MKLTGTQVEHIAELAKLRLTAQEKEQYREQLSAILEHADSLALLDTSGVQPTTSVLELRNVMRPDEAAACLPVEHVLRNAPDREGDQIRVKAILD